MRLAICIPTVPDRQRSLQWTQNFVRLQTPVDTALLIHQHYLVDRNREILADQAIAVGATHILWLDDDCIPPENGISRLLAYRYPWCTGVYRDRHGAPALGWFDPDLPDHLWRKPTEMPGPGAHWYHGCGLGFCLTEVTLLERLPRPWFRFLFFENGHRGEDVYFSKIVHDTLQVLVLADGGTRVAQEEIAWHGADGDRVPAWQAVPGRVDGV